MLRRMMAAMLLSVALVASLVGGAFANGAPVQVQLGKVSGVTNFGEGTPEGAAEITQVEGDVKIRVRGLTRLPNDLYQAWLVNTRTGDRLSVGKFNASTNGEVDFATVVELGTRQFDLVVLTVEPEPDPSSNPDARIALAGFFPDQNPTPTPRPSPGATPVPGATPAPGGTAAPAVTPAPTAAAVQTSVVGALPATRLPRTGGPVAGLIFGAAVVAVGAGIALARGRATRDEQDAVNDGGTS